MVASSGCAARFLRRNVSSERDLLVRGAKLLGVAAVSAVLTMAAVVGVGRALLPQPSLQPADQPVEAELIQIETVGPPAR